MADAAFDPLFYGWLTEATAPKSGAAGLIDLVLRRVTYKPGWTFAVSETNGVIRIHAQVSSVDSRTGQDRIQHAYRVVGVVPNPYTPALVPPTDEEGVLLVLRRAIQEWECHEADEWLRIDGEIHHDPHVCRTCLLEGCRA